MWFLTIGGAEIAIGLGAGLTGHDAVRDSMSVVQCLTVDAAMALAIVVRRPAARAAWILLLAAQVAFTVGIVLVLVSRQVFGDYRFEPIAIAFYALQYLLLGAGLWALIRRRTAAWSAAVAIDVSIVGTSAVLLAWLYLLAPLAGLPDTTVQERVGLLSYPILDLVILSLSLRLIFDAGQRPLSYFLLLAANLAQLVGDTGYIVQRIEGTWDESSWFAAMYVAAAFLLCASAVHPSMTRLDRATTAVTSAWSLRRLAVLYLAALVAPVVLAVQHFRGDLRLALVIAVACAVLFSLVVARMFGFVREQQLLAATDALTGVHSRRRLDDAVDRLVHAPRKRAVAPVALLVDVDFFKRINDTHGHDVGDEVLRAVARRLSRDVRHHDLVARYGGEEFVVLLHDADLPAATEAAERLRRAIADEPVTTEEGARITVTASFGVAPLSDLDTTGDAWLRRADRALYRAKESGRNRVVVTDELAAVP